MIPSYWDIEKCEDAGFCRQFSYGQERTRTVKSIC